MQPLRLGSSTASLNQSIPEDIRRTIDRNPTPSPDERKQIRAIARRRAEQIAQSGIVSLEYFTTVPMLALGMDNPMLDMVRGLRDDQEVWSVHAPFGNGLDLASPDENTRVQSVKDTVSAAKLAGELGARVLTVHPGLELPNMEPRSIRLQASGRSMAEIADVCAGIGVRVAVEILPRKCIGNSLDELFTILEAADRPNIGVCLDSNHTFPASALPDVVRKLGSKLATLHISDDDNVDERHWLPMKGVIEWPAFIRTLIEIGYSGPFMYEATLAFSDLGAALNALEENYNTLMATAGA